jgi:hypothetical protein
LDQWIRLCAVQGTPFSQPSKITDEFKKRMNAEGTHDAKEKLNFSQCDLNDQQVIALSRVLAENPKIAFFDFTENDNIGEAVSILSFFSFVIFYRVLSFF